MTDKHEHNLVLIQNPHPHSECTSSFVMCRGSYIVVLHYFSLRNNNNIHIDFTELYSDIRFQTYYCQAEISTSRLQYLVVSGVAVNNA